MWGGAAATEEVEEEAEEGCGPPYTPCRVLRLAQAAGALPPPRRSLSKLRPTHTLSAGSLMLYVSAFIVGLPLRQTLINVFKNNGVWIARYVFIS